jgi:hypothetical protein
VCALCALARTLAYIHSQRGDVSLCTQSLTHTYRGEDRSFSAGPIALINSHTRGGARARMHARHTHTHSHTIAHTRARARVTHTRDSVTVCVHAHKHTHTHTHTHSDTLSHTHTYTVTHTHTPPVTQRARAHTHAHTLHTHMYTRNHELAGAPSLAPLSSCIATALDGTDIRGSLVCLPKA